MDCAGHRTHVAGIVASSYEDLPGVAPDARLRIYNVFGCGGSSMEDVIAQGFIQAYEEGADIISASLGSNAGPFYTSSAANGFGVTAVGSVEHTQTAAFTVIARSSNNETREILYVSSDTAQWTLNGTKHARFLNQNYTGLDSCHIWEFPGISSDIVLILPRSTCICECWHVLDSNLFGTSVKWVFSYSFEDAAWGIPDRSVYNPEEQLLGFGLISQEDGKWLVRQNERGRKVDFDFVANGGKAVGNTGVNSDRLKPEISAPGGSILSTYLTSEGGWAVLSGTSMATPYRMAAAPTSPTMPATRPAASSPQVASQSLIMMEAALWRAGIVDAFKVITYKTTITPAMERDRGNIIHEAGSTICTKPDSDPVIALPPVPYSSNGAGLATVKFSTTTLDVAPGTTGILTVTFTEPAAIDAKLFPIYGGYINIIGSNDESLRVTYAGHVYGSNIWADEWIDPVVQNPDFVLIQENDTFKMTIEDTFTIDFDILWPTREYSFDLVDPSWETTDWSYPFIPGQDKYIGSLQHCNLISDTYFDAPVQQYPRLPSSTWWPSGNFSHGGAIESGEYKILSRALRTYGDYHNVSDWQIRVSPRTIVDKDKA
ncbi:peptidase S8/S53 domain-containing protein [Colletotrichum acutatum]|uniref:Peptidase S8/S53 domain-containing protein n=1 Tax=Glomerella acutata TaxID=27357 RepID=A0AAD8UU12_GLOAC|nr:peptidase S8/S53 domain-containing protein [Colletotrichum acutatum]KAK1727104.1 peptidase S8/S53 domain-containing protein [Colletotrichum acutatum]